MWSRCSHTLWGQLIEVEPSGLNLVLQIRLTTITFWLLGLFLSYKVFILPFSRSISNNWYQSSFSWGTNLISLRVPPNTQIHIQEIKVQFDNPFISPRVVFWGDYGRLSRKTHPPSYQLLEPRFEVVFYFCNMTKLIAFVATRIRPILAPKMKMIHLSIVLRRRILTSHHFIYRLC